ncbi:MAG: rod shape-determining protein MreC [Azoarcus sp.]|nr:rod shape-determining protein MreC [Azoarcus sp.]
MSLAGHPSPPSFRRGLSPLARLGLLCSICLVMLIADIRFGYLEVVRQVVSVAIHPLQRVAAAPVDFLRNATVYFATLVDVQVENAELRRSQVEAAQRLLRFEQLERENAELRGLAGLSQAVALTGVGAEILYDAPDPFSRKVILDKGAHHGIRGGLAVVDARGLIGQVTRVYPVQAEVTLLTDREQVVPVQIERTGLRGVLAGSGRGELDMRFVPVGTDVQPGDRLVTSGLDGLFVAGLPVAVVSRVGSGDGVFLEVECEPIGRVERAVQVLAVGRSEAPPPRPGVARAAKGEEASEAGAAQ